MFSFAKERSSGNNTQLQDLYNHELTNFHQPLSITDEKISCNTDNILNHWGEMELQSQSLSTS